MAYLFFIFDNQAILGDHFDSGCMPFCWF